jgi:hypothetical protein
VVCDASWKFIAARRAALAAGYVECLVSREAVEALRKWGNGPADSDDNHGAYLACIALARDLAALLKEPT